MSTRNQLPTGVSEEVFAIATEYMHLVWDAMGSYFDAQAGIRRVRGELIDFQTGALEQLRLTRPQHANLAYLDSQVLDHQFAATDRLPQQAVHRSTQGEFKARTADDGRDLLFLGNMFLTFVYGAWEDKYRELLAVALGMKKDDLKSDLFGDLGKMRHAAVHNRMIATEKVEHAEILRLFNRGQLMVLPAEAIFDIFHRIDSEVVKITGMQFQGQEVEEILMRAFISEDR